MFLFAWKYVVIALQASIYTSLIIRSHNKLKCISNASVKLLCIDLLFQAWKNVLTFRRFETFTLTPSEKVYFLRHMKAPRPVCPIAFFNCRWEKFQVTAPFWVEEACYCCRLLPSGRHILVHHGTEFQNSTVFQQHQIQKVTGANRRKGLLEKQLAVTEPLAWSEAASVSRGYFF